ncbi:glycosyltransferase involved in cell wall biogenesis [Candidatus Moduliflexus flocculans]|uniref:Glycosyltransferase involved in cell wall biogenesis n=1 Tax=Candidatus Moduliflexus flocculans TaxID=1499966 RepID=A0A081BMW0_9BACT|nr:glycosyltransferase involved in cell wall biogenesis [Candidatus Moduliflexus flocculans]
MSIRCTMLPRISIVTPAFQHYHFLKACVASIEMQGYPHVEHLVLDGGSTDGTAEYLAKYPGCVTWWRSHRDGGQTQALNEGFARAAGEWIGWQNSDDFYYPGAFWRVAQIAAQYPEVQVIVGETAVVDECGLKKPLVETPAASPQWCRWKDALRDLLSITGSVAPMPPMLWLRGYWPHNQALFIRRDLLQQVIPLDESLHLLMDLEFFAKIALLQPRIAYVSQQLGAFRRYEGIKTDSAALVERKLRERAILQERFQQPMWHDEGLAYQWFRLRHYWYAFRYWGIMTLARRLANSAERRDSLPVIYI